MGISDFVSSGSSGGSKAERFAAASKGKSKREVRLLEQQLLKPAVIPTYTGKEATARAIGRFSVKFVLPSEKAFEMLKRHFKVAGYIESNISQCESFLAFLRALDKGRLYYDKERDRIACRRCRDHKGESEVGAEKQGMSRRTR